MPDWLAWVVAFFMGTGQLALLTGIFFRLGGLVADHRSLRSWVEALSEKIETMGGHHAPTSSPVVRPARSAGPRRL